MRCWTIQKAGFMNQRGNVLRTSWARADAHLAGTYRDLCAWLRGQGRWSSRAAPVWAWVVFSGKTRRPDLRARRHDAPGTRCVMLELEVPRGEALCMNFAAWEDLLSANTHSRCSFTHAERWERATLRRLLVDERHVYRKGGPNRPYSVDGTIRVQAILPRIRREWICGVTEFVAR